MKPPLAATKDKPQSDGWKQLHFRISGEFVTNISRNLWAEGEEVKGLNLLVEGLHGMTEVLALKILTGKKKLVGWDSKIRLEPDNATKDNRGIPLPQSLVEVIRKKEKQFSRKKEEHDSLADTVVRRINAEEDACIGQDSPGVNLLQDMESIIGPAREHIKNPVPTTEFSKWDCGWLAPNGDFYGCHYAEHIGLSQNLEDKLGFKMPLIGDIDSIGWIKLQRDEWFYPWKSVDAGMSITQPQLNLLFDWHKIKNKKLEEWMTA